MNEHGDIILGACVVFILATLLAVAIVRLCAIVDDEPTPVEKDDVKETTTKRVNHSADAKLRFWVPVPIILMRIK